MSTYILLVLLLPITIATTTSLHQFKYICSRECFHSIASNLANFYSKLSNGGCAGNETDYDNYCSENGSTSDLFSRTLEGLVYPALRVHLLPSEIETPLHETFVEIAALEQLYKVFERC